MSGVLVSRSAWPGPVAFLAVRDDVRDADAHYATLLVKGTRVLVARFARCSDDGSDVKRPAPAG